MTNKFIILSVEMVHKFLHMPKLIKLCTLYIDGLVYVNHMPTNLLKKQTNNSLGPKSLFLNLKFIVLFSIAVFDFIYETVIWFYQISWRKHS